MVQDGTTERSIAKIAESLHDINASLCNIDDNTQSRYGALLREMHSYVYQLMMAQENLSKIYRIAK